MYGCRRLGWSGPIAGLPREELSRRVVLAFKSKILASLPAEAFSRDDESDDALFYSIDRFVSHLDQLALDTIEHVIGQLLTEESPSVLDLMASWDSHLPQRFSPSRVVGLGLNENELKANRALTEIVIHDLNRNPRLPFEEGAFDAALCTVSVDYMTRPVDVFREVGRALKPGGVFAVSFSNRFFPPKAVKVWRESSEELRVTLVQEFFRESGVFEAPQLFVSRGKPRPRDDKYAHLDIPSDPVYFVYADRKGGPPRSSRVVDARALAEEAGGREVARRTLRVKDTLRCPHCDVRLSKWKLPQTPFTEWPNEFFYVCFNDECPYFIRGWDSMGAQGNPGSYRFMFNHLRGTTHPLPVPNRAALRDGIVDDEDEDA